MNKCLAIACYFIMDLQLNIFGIVTMPYQYRFRIAVHLYKRNKESFVRFILPKLDIQQLNRFVNSKGNKLMRDLLKDRYFDERFVLQTWMHMKHAMSRVNFAVMVTRMLETESRLQSTNENRKLESFLCLCCEIWDGQSYNFRRLIITCILSNSKFFIYNRCNTGHRTSSKFLLFILSSASFEARRLFWQRWWSHLIGSKDIQDLDQLMKICFRNQDEITLFKENIIAKSETLYDLCISLLHGPYWDKLNNLVDFCCPDMETARHFKQQLLRVNLLSENTRFWYAYIGKTEEFNDFVNDAFNNADFAAEFKNQLMSSPVIQYRLSRSVRSSIALSINLIKFIETFVSNEEIMRQIKTCIIGHLKEDAIANSSTVKNEYVKPPFVKFLLWCFGSEEEVTKFKQVYILPFIR
ncbi:uncharacterized protein LOC135848095 [Planococcus citri]|uniref:uncharacterized protein LOC135848095 n=1 Tax=Planococcus citri TaxID=170843 RepID=UPI0031F88FC5